MLERFTKINPGWCSYKSGFAWIQEKQLLFRYRYNGKSSRFDTGTGHEILFTVGLRYQEHEELPELYMIAATFPKGSCVPLNQEQRKFPYDEKTVSKILNRIPKKSRPYVKRFMDSPWWEPK